MENQTSEGVSAPVVANESQTQASTKAVESDNISLAERVQKFREQSRAKPEAVTEAEAPATTEEVATPETETQEAAPEVPPEESDSNDSSLHEEGIPEEVQGKINKRIGKYAARAKSAEEAKVALEQELQAAKAKLAELESAPPPQVNQEPITVQAEDPNDLTASVRSMSDLDKKRRDAEATVEAIDSHEYEIRQAMSRGEDEITISDKSYKVKELLAIKQNAERQLKKYIPKRAEFIKQVEESEKMSKAKFPDLYKHGTEANSTLNHLKRTYPALNSIPHVDLLIGYGLRGLAAEQSEAKATTAKQSAKPVTAPPPKADVSTTVAPKSRAPAGTAALSKQVEDAKRAYDANPDVSNRIRLQKLQDQQKQLNKR